MSALKVRESMAEERAQTSFNTRELTYYLDGGKEETEKMEKLMLEFERDPVFRNDRFYDLTKAELRKQTIERIAKWIGHMEARDGIALTPKYGFVGLIDSNVYTRLGVHFGLFYSSVVGNGTDEQLAYWKSKGAATLKNFYGCFGMTELAHGSNVAGLETTATFDEETDEFVINTPHIGATKWWIGGAAHSANHCCVVARLIVRGKDYGVKNFIVPLRSTKDHTLCAGIALGDIGKKMGRDGIDNGWIQFTNVRIPRSYMLMRFAKVTRDGQVFEPPLNQLGYGALIGGRVGMVNDSYLWGKKYLTIALRYAAVRRQFSSSPGSEENKIIDYPLHQRRLLPSLAHVFAMRAASHQLSQQYESTMERVRSVNQRDAVELKQTITDLKELFATSAGLKAFNTWATASIIDECRQACGGHGYSGYSGFGQGYNDWVVQCTWEGDNNVLTLSTGRALIQNGLLLLQGKRVGKAMQYLAEKNTPPSGRKDVKSAATILDSWKYLARSIIHKTVGQFVDLTQKQGLSPDQAFEKLSQQRYLCARIHTRYYMVTAFYESIQSEAAQYSAPVKEALMDLFMLFGLHSIENDAGLFLQSEYFSSAEIDEVRFLVTDFCAKVRKNVVGYTDAFNLSDFYLNSPLGNHDGDIYNAYFNKVNALNPPEKFNAPYFEDTIKPFLTRQADDVAGAGLSDPAK